MSIMKTYTLLPVKCSEGPWVYRTGVDPHETNENNEEASEGNEETDDGSSSGDEAVHTRYENNRVKENGTFLQKYVNEQAKLKKVKSKIALLCSAITADPENNLRAMKELINMLKTPSTKMIVTEKKLLILSLMHVYTDVLPSYRIRTNQEVENKKLKKQTKILMNYETSLLGYYKKYIDSLQAMTSDMKGKALRKAKTATERQAVQKIGIVATRCLCDLLVMRYFFNYHKSIISIVVPLACSKNNIVSTLCCKALEDLYKCDKLGEASLEAVKQTVKIIKERKFSIPQQLLRTFLSLKLQEVQAGDKNAKIDMKKIRKQMSMMSRKEKKYKKKMQELEKQLRETEAEESKESKSKLQAEILKKVFWVYFHVLKDDEKLLLITPVLEGLSKFAHLINLEFFDDLSVVLCNLMENGNLSDTEKLYCMQTLFTILSGQAEFLNIDPQRLYAYLYNILLNLQNNTNSSQFDATFKCLDLMLVKRKKQITFNRALAFIKRLLTVCLQAPLQFTLAALSLVRIMFINTKNSDILLDTECGIGSGIYLPELEDPEYCNPRSTALWELYFLLHHYCPVVSTYANHILNGCPLQGKQQLSEKLLRLQPSDILDEYSEIVEDGKIEMERYTRPAKRLCVRNDISQYDTVTESDLKVSWKDVASVNFCNSINQS